MKNGGLLPNKFLQQQHFDINNNGQQQLSNLSWAEQQQMLFMDNNSSLYSGLY